MKFSVDPITRFSTIMGNFRLDDIWDIKCHDNLPKRIHHHKQNFRKMFYQKIFASHKNLMIFLFKTMDSDILIHDMDTEHSKNNPY